MSERRLWDRVLREYGVPTVVVPGRKIMYTPMFQNQTEEDYLHSDAASFCPDCCRWVKHAAGRCRECIHGKTARKRENEAKRRDGVKKLCCETWPEIRERHVVANAQAEQPCFIFPGVLNADVLIYDMKRSKRFNPYRGLSSSKIKARWRRAKKYLYRIRGTKIN
jgi:hypothetical protein